MAFSFTPKEAQATALAVAAHFKKRQAKVRFEIAAWKDAPYRTTLVVEKAGLITLVEAQGRASYTKALRELVAWHAARRAYVEVFLATSVEEAFEAGVLSATRQDGVGLLVVEEGKTVRVERKAQNPALVVTPEPTLRFGGCKAEVTAAVTKFNEVDRKDGLRDMCELVERETERLAVAAATKGFITVPLAAIRKMDWSTKIDTLESIRACTAGKTPIVPPALKNDLHSFRGARNLVDHPVPTKREGKKRERQFAERMMQGPRLLAELVALGRKVR